jgi:hypothetical protein
MMKNIKDEFAAYLKVTKRTVQRKAVRECWRYTEQQGLGGTCRLYSFATLPGDIKTKIIAAIIGGQETRPSQDSAFTGVVTSSVPVTNIVLSPPLNPKFIDKTCIKLGVLLMVRQHIVDKRQGKIKGIDDFCQLYNTRQLDIDNAVYDVVKSIRRITILRWEKAETAEQWRKAFSLENKIKLLGHEGGQETQSFYESLKNIAKEVWR